MTKNKKVHFGRITLALALALLLTFVAASRQAPVVQADRASDLRRQINDLQSQINTNSAIATDLDHQADTLAAAVAGLDDQIAAITEQIRLTELKLQEIQLQLEQTRADLAKQKEILRISLRRHYRMGEVRTVELLVDSDSFSDFFDQQTYVNRVRSNIQSAAHEVQRLEEQLEQQEAEQQQLLIDAQNQKAQQEQVRAGKQRLLDETRGQEALYRARVAGLQREHAAADAALDRYIADLVSSGKSLGPVAREEVIGGVGNTGYSTGPHLHFAIQRNGSAVNPLTKINNEGWAWPVPGYGMTQGYHDGHQAIDIGTQGRIGVPIVASQDGEIIHRGCLGEGRFRNYAVLIRHSGDYVSRNIHMNPPADPAYDSCRANYNPAYY